jgi:hypothetical protein
MLIATLFPNRTELNLRQGVLHGDLQSLHYYLVDMHTQYPKIEEDNEFPKVLSTKQNLEMSEI